MAKKEGRKEGRSERERGTKFKISSCDSKVLSPSGLGSLFT